MGTVEWSELLRWVPRGSQEEPGQEFQTSNQRETPSQTETFSQTPIPAKGEPGKLTLASL